MIALPLPEGCNRSNERTASKTVELDDPKPDRHRKQRGPGASDGGEGTPQRSQHRNHPGH